MATKRAELEDRVFSKLTVGMWDKGRQAWRCVCRCGNTTYVCSTDLTRTDGKAVKACKMCGNKAVSNKAIERTGYNGAVNKLFYTYKRSAFKTKRVFSLSREELYTLSQSDCTYCGQCPSQTLNNGSNTGFVPFKYNGIDRVDNSKGYIVENCVPCCNICNKAKSSLSIETFNAWIKRIATHNKGLLDEV